MSPITNSLDLSAGAARSSICPSNLALQLHVLPLEIHGILGRRAPQHWHQSGEPFLSVFFFRPLAMCVFLIFFFVFFLFAVQGDDIQGWADALQRFPPPEPSRPARWTGCLQAWREEDWLERIPLMTPFFLYLSLELCCVPWRSIRCKKNLSL